MLSPVMRNEIDGFYKDTLRGLHWPGKIPSVAGKLRESIYQPSLENA